MRTKDRHVVAATVGDIHARHGTPSCRGETDWGEVEQRQWFDLFRILEKNGNPPLLLAGDIFHKWDAKPETISRMINILSVYKGSRRIYAVPGNHDLPYHQLKNIKDSAYWALVEAKAIYNVNAEEGLSDGKPARAYIRMFPFGAKWERAGDVDAKVRIAVLHQYCWDDDLGHPGADLNHHVKTWAKALSGYDVVIFGDNHRPFIRRFHLAGRTMTVRNGGCFIRQTADERHVKPTVGLIYDDGSVDEVVLKGDRGAKFHHERKEDVTATGNEEMKALLDAMKTVHKNKINFDAACRAAASKLSGPARKLVLSFLGEE